MDMLRLDDIETLIRAADARDDELRKTITDLGAERVARLLVDEIVFRADPANVHRELDVNLEIDTEDAASPIRYVLRVRPDGGIGFSTGTSEHAVHAVTYDCAGLVRDLFGSRRETRVTRRATRHRFEQAYDESVDHHLLASVLYSQRATAAVLSGIDGHAPNLDELSVRYQSDKWGGVHWFTPHYERHFGQLRNEQLRILEIGIGGYEGPSSGGGSLLTWRRYFPRALVVGVDILDKSGIDQPRITTVRGDQSDTVSLTEIAEKYGPFDIIIDDGSHMNAHVLHSFSVLYQHLRVGGTYVIEDMWTSYCPGYGGDDADVAGPSTSVGLIKSLLDALHHEEHHAAAGRATPGVASTLAGVHVYRNLAFLDKEINVDGGIPQFIPRKGLG